MRYVVLTPTGYASYQVIDTQADHPRRALMAEPADKVRAERIAQALNATTERENSNAAL